MLRQGPVQLDLHPDELETGAVQDLTIQQLTRKNPWKTVFVFLTTTLSTACWFYRYFRLQEVPLPSAQALQATRPVTRTVGDPQAAMGLVTGTQGKSRSLPEQIPSTSRFEVSLDPVQEFQEDLRKALLHALAPAFLELPKFLGDPMAQSPASGRERFLCQFLDAVEDGQADQ